MKIRLFLFIQVRMRANPPPQSGVQCLGQARTLRFICFYSVIEPAERESRRAPRGKPARPCFRTHSVRPNWNPDLHSNFVDLLILVPPGGCRFASFWVPFLVYFGGLWVPFCIILETFGVHWASLEGSLEEGWFFVDFWRPK